MLGNTRPRHVIPWIIYKQEYLCSDMSLLSANPSRFAAGVSQIQAEMDMTVGKQMTTNRSHRETRLSRLLK